LSTDAKTGGRRVRGEPRADAPGLPLITVITVTLDAARVLENAIHSVASQSYPNVEYVVVDGGSSDGTLDILRSHEDVVDLWVSEKDAGVYDAMNKGVRLSRGAWILFLGADDLLVDCLATVATHLSDPNTIVYGDVYWKGFHELYAGEFSPWRLLNQNICHQAIFYPRSVFDAYKFDPKYRLCADHFLNIQCLADPRFQLRHVPVLVALYSDAGMSTGGSDAAFARDVKALVREHMPGPVGAAFLARKWVVESLEALGAKRLIKRWLGIRH
jgi:glycosyltransferase involved in cell wall biosynthesis